MDDKNQHEANLILHIILFAALSHFFRVSANLTNYLFQIIKSHSRKLPAVHKTLNQENVVNFKPYLVFYSLKLHERGPPRKSIAPK